MLYSSVFIDENVTVEATVANIRKNKVTVTYRYYTDDNKVILRITNLQSNNYFCLSRKL